MLSAIAGASLCGCNDVPQEGDLAHFTKSDLDESVSLKDDFYQHTNGGWIAKHPIPGDRSRYGSFDILSEESETKLREIVEEAQKQNAAKGTAAQKIGDLYALGLDTARRDAEGLKPIERQLKMAREIDYSKPKEFAETLGELSRAICQPFVFLSSRPDFENSTVNISDLWQTGIGLPDRDYCFDNSEHGLQIINAYKKFVSEELRVAGLDNTEERAEKVFQFEKQIAELMNKKEENRDPQMVCHKYEFADLSAQAPGLDWEAYCKAAGADVKTVNVSQPRFFGNIFALVGKTDKETLRDYMTSQVISGTSSCLTTELSDITFEFYGKALRGQSEQRPLWKRTLSAVDGAMGEELGKLFVAKYFPPESKQRMVELIEQLRTAFSERIGDLTWMSDETKAAAKDKLAAITFKIGYPDKWKDYSKLEIDPQKSYAENMIAVWEFSHKVDMDKINNPVDKTEWHMTPQTVNAYYNPTANEIVFPAAILQPPFFYSKGDDAVNYGAIGVVIGHEMTHGFDDMGSQYDKEGNLKDWWTADDKAQFQQITQRLSDRFSNLTVIGTIKGNGKLTLGENIADLGGLNIAHQAFRNTLKGKAEPAEIDGQTAEQRFLLGYSRIWASNATEEALKQQVMVDPHSTAKLRVNGQLPLLDFFYKAFDIKEGDKMYLPEEERIVIW